MLRRLRKIVKKVAATSHLNDALDLLVNEKTPAGRMDTEVCSTWPMCKAHPNLPPSVVILNLSILLKNSTFVLSLLCPLFFIIDRLTQRF
ncbi:MAG: hypothetical protein ACR5K7_05340 [Symbiopectobacterium sp.]